LETKKHFKQNRRAEKIFKKKNWRAEKIEEAKKLMRILEEKISRNKQKKLRRKHLHSK